MAIYEIAVGHANNGTIPAHAMGGRLLCLGREGEHITQKLTFDVSVWLEDMPDAWVDIHVSPPDGEGYLVPLDVREGKGVWTITEDDLAQAGYGSIELIATDQTTGERKKSSTARTIIHESQSHKEPEDMPPRHVPWWQKVLAAIRGVVLSVNGVTPDENGNVKIETGTKGAVTSVNGVKPDEDGNVQIEVGGAECECEAATDDEIVEVLFEMGALPAITDENGAILTDENNAILMV